MIFTQMDLQGLNRRRYTPPFPPPQTSNAWKKRRTSVHQQEVAIFEPYEETLPLQSGVYSYVIDATGRFRVKRGNTSSHAAMVSGASACAAGRIRVNRHGNTAHVTVFSSDYIFNIRTDWMEYIVGAFSRHTAFSLSPNAIFQFHKGGAGITEKFFLSPSLSQIDNPYEQIRILEEEGLGDIALILYTPDQVVRYHTYIPPAPPCVYPMHLDQEVTSIDGSDEGDFEYGAAARRLDATQQELRTGKNNFVIDSQGWLIVDMSGHQILSGGNPVGAAGHIHIQSTGIVDKLDLNFSGHYRPRLSADYVRYTYRVFAGHPLISLAKDCEYFGRWFDESSMDTRAYRFDRADLETDDPKLDDYIDSLGW